MQQKQTMEDEAKNLNPNVGHEVKLHSFQEEEDCYALHIGCKTRPATPLLSPKSPKSSSCWPSQMTPSFQCFWKSAHDRWKARILGTWWCAEIHNFGEILPHKNWYNARKKQKSFVLRENIPKRSPPTCKWRCDGKIEGLFPSRSRQLARASMSHLNQCVSNVGRVLGVLQTCELSDARNSAATKDENQSWFPCASRTQC